MSLQCLKLSLSPSVLKVDIICQVSSILDFKKGSHNELAPSLVLRRRCDLAQLHSMARSKPCAQLVVCSGVNQRKTGSSAAGFVASVLHAASSKLRARREQAVIYPQGLCFEEPTAIAAR